MTDDDFSRLEAKVDKLGEAIGKLILFEERQANQGERIGRCEAQLAAHDVSISRVDRKVEMWINRGIGVWGLAVTLFALVQYGAKFLGH